MTEQKVMRCGFLNSEGNVFMDYYSIKQFGRVTQIESEIGGGYVYKFTDDYDRICFSSIPDFTITNGTAGVVENLEAINNKFNKPEVLNKIWAKAKKEHDHRLEEITNPIVERYKEYNRRQ